MWGGLEVCGLFLVSVKCVYCIYASNEKPCFPPDTHWLWSLQAGSKEVRVMHYYRPQYKGPRSTYRKSPDLKLQLLLLDRCVGREGRGGGGCGGDDKPACGC